MLQLGMDYDMVIKIMGLSMKELVVLSDEVLSQCALFCLYSTSLAEQCIIAVIYDVHR